MTTIIPMNRRIAWWLVPILVALACAPARPAETRTRFFRDLAAGSSLHFQRWRGEGALNIREVSLPLVCVFPVTRRLSVDVTTGLGMANLDRGASSRLAGLTDTRIRASFIVGDEWALLTVGAGLPTGKTELDADEQQVSNYLAQNALGFRTPHFGQGLEVNAGLAVARKVGESVAGAGIGYLAKGEFAPWKGGPDYRPGSELNLTAGLDRGIMDGDGRISLDAVYTLYGKDELDGVETFRSGDKLLVQILGLCRAKEMDWRLRLTERGKGKNTNYWGVGETEYSSGNQFEADLSALRATAGKVGWRGRVGLKVYGDNEFDRGEAVIVGMGPGIRYRLAPRRHLDVDVQYARGRIDGAAVGGLDISASIWLEM